MIVVERATTHEQLDHVRRLIRAFLGWHRQRHKEDLRLIDQYFGARAFEEELASLPGTYAPPNGCLLLACHDGRPAGCVALRMIDGQRCEMKRMFVYPQFQGKGCGRALAEAVVQEARAIGYGHMYLDTSVRQTEAQTLYQSRGFKRTEPYYELPEELRNWLVFMELSL